MRHASIVRKTNETSIELMFEIDGSGQAQINTGIGFYDHMLTLFAGHGLFDLRVGARGDLHVDEHHTAEDVAICLGKALDQALGDRAGIVRLACEIHEHMEGVILVVDTPYFQKTDADGTFRLEGLPAGRFVLKAWVSEKQMHERPVELVPGARLRVDFRTP